MSYQKRIDLLMGHLKDIRYGAVALIPGPSMYYFTGLSFHLMERPVTAVACAWRTTSW